MMSVTKTKGAFTIDCRSHVHAHMYARNCSSMPLLPLAAVAAAGENEDNDEAKQPFATLCSIGGEKSNKSFTALAEANARRTRKQITDRVRASTRY